jgi:serine/threonine protein kinase
MKAICGIVNGMIYLHSRKVVHGRIHPRNILFDKGWEVRIGDYGRFRVKQNHSAPDLPFQLFMSPEAFTTGRSTVESDVYSFGMLLYYCLVGEPFSNAREMEAVPKIVNGYRQRVPAQNRPISPCDETVYSEDRYPRILIAIAESAESRAFMHR